ncbi:MAG: carboxynorspermidine decarboxylase [Candidatus Omnitrophica bacterium]|nr:carboxynorspermidine decarboxylase [Candidatus Omnitrophota bacterium]MDD5429708.1 carboxynorspermidine decarboxylase [Candidatus Omnitrophota bacterium]
MRLKTPYYLIHERKLLKNLKTIQALKKSSGAKFLLALKCFSGWCVFNLISKYMDGTTSSSLNEARLGKEKFSKETHLYCVAFSGNEVKQARMYADTIIFNSISQLKKFHKDTGKLRVGLRINPGVSFSNFSLADPARKYSRLGVIDKKELLRIGNLISGVLFHFNCENNSFKDFSSNLDFIENTYGNLLERINWVSLGGGISFTQEGYPLPKLSERLKRFREKFNIQLYMEPGEAVIANSAELITTVIDVVRNNINIAIVEVSTEAHMLDLLVYGLPAKIKTTGKGKHKYIIAGRSCLAGDIFGIFRFKRPLRAGKILRISDAAGYTMVKKNWFNGLDMPSIAVKKMNGTIKTVRKFSYDDFLNSLS